jgi:hypothetical protein
MANSPHHPVLVFDPYDGSQDWPFTDPSMVRAQLPPPEISGKYGQPGEYVIRNGEIAVALLTLGLKPIPEYPTGFRDEKIRIILVEKQSDNPRETRHLFDQKIIYQETLNFVESIVSDMDRIVLDITAENYAVCRILKDYGLLLLPDKDPIGKEAIHDLKKRSGLLKDETAP